MIKQVFVKENLYLIIPAICIGIWALISTLDLGCCGVPLWTGDYVGWYLAGRQILENPGKLYDVYGYHYLPSFAVFFAITFSNLPFIIGFYCFFIINYILGILIIREFNKILILMNIKQKIHRFMFLMIISNGTYVFYQFRCTQSKFYVLLIFLFIIKRELLFEKGDLVKNLKQYLINYGLLVFAIGMAPYFIFLLLIYVFYDIPIKEFFNKDNIKKYIIAIGLFLIENILFIIYPSSILDFLNGYRHSAYYPSGRRKRYKVSLLNGMVISRRFMNYIIISSILILSITSLILILSKNLRIEEKFGYFSLIYLIFGAFSNSIYLYLMLFSLVLLLFVPHLNQNLNGTKFLKHNIIFLIGLGSLFSILLIPVEYLGPNVYILLDNIPIFIFFSIMMISLIQLKSKRYKI